MEYRLTRGCALVLIGAQGCGKTTLARKIAEAHGSYREIDAAQLDSKFGLGAALDSEPNTLIVEGFPGVHETMERVKDMLTNDTVFADRKGASPKQVKAPNFIFCTGHSDALNLVPADRRFCIMRLG